MTEQNTEPTEEMNEPIEVVTPEPTPIKSKKARSELQLKALANARQAAYKKRAEQAAIKKQNKSKKTPEVSIEFQKSYPDVSKDDSKDVSKDDPAEIPDDSKYVLPENENKNENIRDDVKKESETVAEESHKERIERHAERKQFTDHINSIIDERVRYKPIVKSKYKLVNAVYVIR
jgi:hypothetical protein